MTSLVMLWEPHDAAVVLRERFGHDGAPGAAAWLGSVLSQDFGRQMASCDKIVMSDSNALAWLQTFDGDRLILKWSSGRDRFAGLEAFGRGHGLAAARGAAGLGSSSRCGRRLQVARDGVSVGLQQVLPGHLLDVNEPAEVFAAGAMLAELHTALARGLSHPS